MIEMRSDMSAAPSDGTRCLVWDGQDYHVAEYGWLDERACEVWWTGEYTVEAMLWGPLPYPSAHAAQSSGEAQE